jgi:hypothetical protein
MFTTLRNFGTISNTANPHLNLLVPTWDAMIKQPFLSFLLLLENRARGEFRMPNLPKTVDKQARETTATIC